MADRVQRAEARVPRQGAVAALVCGRERTGARTSRRACTFTRARGWNAPSAQVWHIKGDGPNRARIELSDEVYFLTCGRIESTIFEGLSFVGGKGAFRSTWTKNMVGGRHIFRDCYFVDYSECAHRQQRRRFAVSLRRRLHLLRAGEVAGHRHRLGRVLRRRARSPAAPSSRTSTISSWATASAGTCRSARATASSPSAARRRKPISGSSPTAIRRARG